MMAGLEHRQGADIMDHWKTGLRRALGETIGPVPEFGLNDAISAARRIAKFNRLSSSLKGLDTMAAARKGIGPAELAAIMGMRISEIDPKRLDHLYAVLIEHKLPK